MSGIRHYFASLREALLYVRTWGAVALAALLGLIGMVIVPRLAWRRALTGRLMWLILRLNGVRVQCQGRENLPTGTAVVVANHASFLDGPMLHMLLPSRYGFVIKREVTRTPGLHFLLRRLGSVFADRESATRAGRDGQFIIRCVREGRCLGIFPEGSVLQEPGLRAFRMGAFLAATRAGVPVVPVTINGSRAVFHDSHPRLHPGRITVQIGTPIAPLGNDRAAAAALRDAVRAQIAADLDEPDLKA